MAPDSGKRQLQHAIWREAWALTQTSSLVCFVGVSKSFNLLTSLFPYLQNENNKGTYLTGLCEGFNKIIYTKYPGYCLVLKVPFAHLIQENAGKQKLRRFQWVEIIPSKPTVPSQDQSHCLLLGGFQHTHPHPLYTCPWITFTLLLSMFFGCL